MSDPIDFSLVIRNISIVFNMLLFYILLGRLVWSGDLPLGQSDNAQPHNAKPHNVMRIDFTTHNLVQSSPEPQ